MSNINWNQFLNNNYNNFQNANNVANTTNTSLNQNGTNLVQQQKTPLEVLLPNYIAQLANTSNELAELNRQQTVDMLKELLKMPKNFDKLLEQLTTMQMNSEQQITKTALLLLASRINLSQLADLLKGSSKEAMTNLYRMLAQFNQMGVSIKDEQLSQISKLISFISASSSSDVQSLRSTMLMYLPWLPLTDPDAFKLEISSKGAIESSIVEDSVTVLIATENYGNIKAFIYKTGDDSINLELNSSQTFPQKVFVDLMKEEAKKHSVNINYILSVNEIFNKEKNEKSQTQVYMNTSPGVNPFLLLMSNNVIRIIHETDSKENLRIQRKERTDGKS